MTPTHGRLLRILSVVVAACTAGMAAACANAGQPPGGPPDVTAPVILGIAPKTMTVGAKLKDLEIRFNEVISETPKNATSLDGLVFISPRVKDASVDWHRDRLTVHPKGGWKPNTVYSVQISSGISDLRNNSIDTAFTVVFSTGGPIPATNITGLAFDWVAGRGANKALIEAIAPDSTTYQVLSDSLGRFDLKHVPAGFYAVRAVVDRNNNRLLDPTEAFDTVRVTLTQRVDVELYAFPHDTVGLRIADIVVTPQDSLRVIKVSFDKPMSPDQQLTRPQFILKRADSTAIGVALVQTTAERAAFDSVMRKRAADSIAAKTPQDTTAAGRARADTLARQRRADSVAALDRAAREARRQVALRGGRPLPPRDTTPPPKMKRAAVSAELYLTLEEALKPGTAYRLQVNSVRSLSGTVKSPARGFVTAKEVKKDSSDAPTRKPPD
ncbi:MAG: Ig-like domain-containing protein [Gemmatimonadaceae bacterium]|nr:Ig-like domain-containing protein [Gemmatimonadaceae bacterium]